MSDSSETALAPIGTAVPALAPRAVTTRRQLARTRVVEGRFADPDLGEDRPSLVTRRLKARRRRTRKRILVGVAIVLGLFPPMWAVYLVTWLIWRSRPKQKSMRYVRRSVRALEDGKTGVALQRLQEAHYLDTSNTDALYWLGLVLSRQGRHEEAAEALSIVARRVPGLPEVEAALVDAYIDLSDPDAAVHHAQRLLDAAPFEVESLLKLADAFEASGRLDLAIDALEQAPLHKRTLTPDLMQVHYRLGALLQEMDKPERALAHFKRVMARDIGFRDVKARVESLESD